MATVSASIFCYVMREGAVRLGKADLGEERGRILLALRQETAEGRYQLGAAPPWTCMHIAATLRAVGLVLGAEEAGLVSVRREDLGEMALVRVQVIGEAGVGQPDDAVGVRVAAGPERGSRRAALGRDAEAVLELERGGCEGVDMRRADAGDAVAAEVAAQVVADEDEDVRWLGVHGSRPF